ncbi:MAG TPA: DNA adenine methylase [Lacunisphaera sp.]|nr:DNA adenine methylase [Lacunisphaera sp.]
MSEVLRAPFPWFGGKRRVADVVWRAFGPDVPNYIEPFAGSLAVLLARPGGAGKIETVNDRDRYLANFWRAVSAEPEAVAAAADWPVNEADLHARHKWLVNQAEFRERMHQDPDFYDVKIAGWWVWGLCQWIGGGWCVEPNNHKHPKLDGIGKGVHSEAGHPKERNARARQRPRMSGDSTGEGVHSRLPRIGGGEAGVHQKRQLPMLAVGTDRSTGAGGRGVHGVEPRRQLPDLGVTGNGNGAAGKGIHSKSVHLPSLGNDRGLNGVSAAPCVDWFRALQARLRRVRVACGDWRRVLGDSVLGKGRNVGGRRPCAVFLDPPYSHEFRDPYLYSEDDAAISAQVREWALEHGDDPDLRIALCGYSGEHSMPATWTEHAWKGARGYAAEGNDNRELERIWFSPHCLPLEGSAQQSLFASGAT